MKPIFFLTPAVVIAALILMLSGCGQPAPNSSDSGGSPSSASSVQPASDAPAENRTITDMAGRTVVIPKDINKVYCSDPVSSIMLYTINPEKLLGWNYALNDLEKSYILQKYHDLPVFGMKDSVNLEAVISYAPDLCITVGNLGQQAVSDANKLQDQTGIPVVLADGSLENSAATYRFLGDVLDEKEKAGQLADYAEETIEAVKKVSIPGDEKIRVYYGNGEDSLETAPEGSVSSEVMDMVGINNVARLELGNGNRMNVSLEQIIYWDPQIIVVNGEPTQGLTGSSAAMEILNNPDFSSITAVKNEMVFGIPKAPFSWIDRPPGPNRLIGLKWLGQLVYPNYFQYDINNEIKRFYQLFYGITLADEQLSELLED